MCSCEIYLQNREHGRETKHHIYVSPNKAIIGSDNEPLSETMMAYCQLNHWGHISVKFESKYNNFH